MNTLITFLSILLITAFGYMIIQSFRLLSRKDKLLAFALSYGLGTGVIAMQMYVYTRFGIPWNKEYLFFPWIIAFIYFFSRMDKEIIIRIPKIHRPRLIDLLLFLGIVQAVCFTVFEALLRPVSAWDAWVTWLLKAKVFFIDARIDPHTINYIRVNYPLVINLLGTFTYIMIGRLDDTAVLLNWSAFYAFTALLLFAVLKKRYGTRYALLFTFLVVTTQNFVRHGGRYEAGLADLPLGYFIFCSTVILFEYFKQSNVKVFFLLNIFLGITGLIKFEGITVGIIIELCALYHIYRHKLFSHIPIIVFWIFPNAEWQIYQLIYKLRDPYFDPAAHKFIIFFPKVVNSFNGTFRELINVKSWNLLWIIYFYILIFLRKKMNKEKIILNLIILCQLSIYMCMYIFTTGNNPESSIERLLMHLAPLAFYYISIEVEAIFPALKKKLFDLKY